jgi:hypothetical protein
MQISYEPGQVPHHFLDLRCGKTLKAGVPLDVTAKDLASIKVQFARSFVRTVQLNGGGERHELVDEPRDELETDVPLMCVFKVDGAPMAPRLPTPTETTTVASDSPPLEASTEVAATEPPAPDAAKE